MTPTERRLRRQEIAERIGRQEITVEEAVRQYRMHLSSIYRACQYHGVKLPRGRRKGISSKWSKVDWSKPLAEIARELHISRQRAHQVKVRMQTREYRKK